MKIQPSPALPGSLPKTLSTRSPVTYTVHPGPVDSVRFGSNAPRLKLNGSDLIKQAIAEVARNDGAKAQLIEQQYNHLKHHFGQEVLVALQIGTVEVNLHKSGVPSLFMSIPMNIVKDELEGMGFSRQRSTVLQDEFQKLRNQYNYTELMDLWKETTKQLVNHFISNQPSPNGIDIVRGEDVFLDTVQALQPADPKTARVLKGLWDDAHHPDAAGSDASLMIYMAGLNRKIQQLNFFIRGTAWSNAKSEIAGMGFGDKVEKVVDLYDQLGGDHKYARLADTYFALSKQQMAHILSTP